VGSLRRPNQRAGYCCGFRPLWRIPTLPIHTPAGQVSQLSIKMRSNKAFLFAALAVLAAAAVAPAAYAACADCGARTASDASRVRHTVCFKALHRQQHLQHEAASLHNQRITASSPCC